MATTDADRWEWEEPRVKEPHPDSDVISAVLFSEPHLRFHNGKEDKPKTVHRCSQSAIKPSRSQGRRGGLGPEKG